MPTVPNWIAKAIVTDPQRLVSYPITSWRATKTQVVVSTATQQEIRFRLDGLTEVGKDRYNPSRYELVAPDDARLAAAQRRAVLDNARVKVMWTVEKVRLQDSRVEIDELLTKLETIRQAVVRAQASLAKVDSDA